MRRLIFMFCVLMLFTTGLYPIKLHSSTNHTLSLSGRLALGASGSYFDVSRVGYFAFLVKSAKLKFKGKYKTNFTYQLSLDFAEPLSTSKSGYNDILQKVFLQWRLSNLFRLRVGQFTVPLGNENKLNLEERPNVYQCEIIDKRTPDLDKGIMFSGRKMFNLLAFDLGAFNGSTISTQVEKNSLRGVGNIYIQLKKSKKSVLWSGYNAAWSGNHLGSSSADYRFTHGIYFHYEQKDPDRARLYFHLEYLEVLDYVSLEKALNNWDRGVGVVGAVRINNLQPTLTFDYYDKDTLFKGYDDTIIGGAGLNVFFNKDNTQFRVFIRDIYHYQKNANDLKLITLLQHSF